MVFNSLTFAVFFAAVLVLYFRLPHRGQNLLLLIASYVFYGAWDWRFCSLLAMSTTVDWWVGLHLDPALPGRELRVDPDLEAEARGVERQRLVLVGDRHDDGADVGDLRRAHRSSSSFSAVTRSRQ